MRAPSGGRAIAEPVGYQNHDQADSIADYDQGDSYTHGYSHHGHAYGHGYGHHRHADTDAHDGDAYVDSHANTNPGADPVSCRYGG